MFIGRRPIVCAAISAAPHHHEGRTSPHRCGDRGSAHKLEERSRGHWVFALSACEPLAPVRRGRRYAPEILRCSCCQVDARSRLAICLSLSSPCLYDGHGCLTTCFFATFY